MDEIQIIILAAGLGKRMQSKDLPKALTLLRGKPLVSYLLDSIKKSGVCAKPVIVVGKMAEKVKAELGPAYTYVLQAEQLGTGHAVMTTKGVNLFKEELGPTYTYVHQAEQLGTGHDVMTTEDELKGKVDDVMVLYGDMPFLTATSIKKLVAAHLAAGTVMTMATVKVPDFAEWRAGFSDFGRIIRDSQGKVCQIVEKKDADPKQLEIKEVNPSYFCFKASWLWQNLTNLKNNNAAGEYYLTDLLGLACQQGKEIATVEIEPKEALGINTEEQLKELEKLL